MLDTAAAMDTGGMQGSTGGMQGSTGGMQGSTGGMQGSTGGMEEGNGVDRQFSHLLKPAKSLIQNWNLDVSAELERYLFAIESEKTSANSFTHAALVLQNMTSSYGKKIEYLLQLTYNSLDSLSLASNRKPTATNNMDATTGTGTRRRTDSRAIDDLIFAVPWDLPTSVHLQLPEYSTGDYSRSKSFALSTTRRTPLAILTRGDHTAPKLSSYNVLSSGALVDPTTSQPLGTTDQIESLGAVTGTLGINTGTGTLGINTGTGRYCGILSAALQKSGTWQRAQDLKGVHVSPYMFGTGGMYAATDMHTGRMSVNRIADVDMQSGKIQLSPSVNQRNGMLSAIRSGDNLQDQPELLQRLSVMSQNRNSVMAPISDLLFTGGMHTAGKPICTVGRTANGDDGDSSDDDAHVVKSTTVLNSSAKPVLHPTEAVASDIVSKWQFLDEHQSLGKDKPLIKKRTTRAPSQISKADITSLPPAALLFCGLNQTIAAIAVSQNDTGVSESRREAANVCTGKSSTGDKQKGKYVPKSEKDESCFDGLSWDKFRISTLLGGGGKGTGSTTTGSGATGGSVLLCERWGYSSRWLDFENVFQDQDKLLKRETRKRLQQRSSKTDNGTNLGLHKAGVGGESVSDWSTMPDGDNFPSSPKTTMREAAEHGLLIEQQRTGHASNAGIDTYNYMNDQHDADSNDNDSNDDTGDDRTASTDTTMNAKGKSINSISQDVENAVLMAQSAYAEVFTKHIASLGIKSQNAADNEAAVVNLQQRVSTWRNKVDAWLREADQQGHFDYTVYKQLVVSRVLEAQQPKVRSSTDEQEIDTAVDSERQGVAFTKLSCNMAKHEFARLFVTTLLLTNEQKTKLLDEEGCDVGTQHEEGYKYSSKKAHSTRDNQSMTAGTEGDEDLLPAFSVVLLEDPNTVLHTNSAIFIANHATDATAAHAPHADHQRVAVKSENTSDSNTTTRSGIMCPPSKRRLK